MHCFLDGRDTPPASGKDFVAGLEQKMAEIGVGKVASVMGRYYVMDRDKRWDRVELAYRTLTEASGATADSATGGIQASYDADKTDEFVVPFSVMENGKPVAVIKEHDSVIFFNFRPDRAREITRAFCDDAFDGFKREKRMELVYVCFTNYDETIGNKLVAFHKQTITNTFGEFLAAHGMTQARIAETEKYAHVTFFFNGGVEEPNEGEDRILVPSPKVATYDLQPEMSAPAVCDKLVEAITSGKYDVIIINFANPDMVDTPAWSRLPSRPSRPWTLRGQGRGRGEGDGRRPVHLRRPWKCRAAGGLRHRRAVHRSHHQPGSVHSRECGSVL